MFSNSAVGRRTCGHSLLQKSKEKFASMARSAAIKAEREFVKVAIQMFGTHSPLMCSNQPPFQKRYDSVNTGQEVRRRFLPLGHPVHIPFLFNPRSSEWLPTRLHGTKESAACACLEKWSRQ
jgi:hypothetical protein